MKNNCIRKRINILIPLLFAVILSSCGIPSANNTSGKGQSVDFAGEWTDEAGGPTVVDIWVDDAGIWHGEISRSDDDAVASFWSFSASAEGNTLIYTDMQHMRGIYDEEGEVTEDNIYSDGSGKLILTDGKLSWQDDKEGAGNGLLFIYSGEY